MVALKLLPATGGIGFVERFNREARALARLNHPNIVAVHEFGQVDGQAYFLMEFVDGANLRQLERAGRLAPREALQIIPQICDALQYAHDEGVVHRDIKPENVLVDRKGRVKIADFGLAKILDAEPESFRLTREGQVMGTPHYMAPEQLERPLAVDHRADIYSLGVVFYEMLTGELPLGKFSPPSRKVEVDVRLDAVVLRALENDPVLRYQKASEVKTGVESIAQNIADKGSTSAMSPSAPSTSYVSWLAQPLLQENDGHRRVYSKGVLRAFGFGLLFITLGSGPLFLYLGSDFPGWASLLIRLGLTLSTIGLGLWWTWRSHRPALPPKRNKRGQETFARLPFRFALLFLSLGVLLAFGVELRTKSVWQIRQRAGVGSLSQFHLPTWFRGSIAPAPPVQVAAPNPNSPTLEAMVPGRGYIKLEAILPAVPSGGEAWLPDGSTMTNLGLDIRGLAASKNNAAAAYDLVFQNIGGTQPFDATLFESEPDTDPVWKGTAWRDGAQLTDRWAMRVTYSPETTQATLRFGWPQQPWRTVVEHRPGRSMRARRDSAEPRWPTTFHYTYQSGPGVRVTFKMGPEAYANHGLTSRATAVVPSPAERNWQVRVVVLDRDGNLHLPNPEITENQQEDSSADTEWTFGFPQLTTEQIGEVRLEVQPVQWIEFPNVPLRPSTFPLAERSRSRFGPIETRTFTELIDFDTGATADFPATPGSAPFPASIGENLAWMQQHGFDAVAGVDHLDTLGVTVVNLANSEWDTLTPDELIQRLRQEGAFRMELPAPEGARYPVTFGFRTRESGTGIFQWLTNAPAGSSATVRYKLLIPPHGP